MAATAETRLKKALKHAGAVRARELEAAGIPRTQIARLVAAGKLQKIGRGLYASPDYQGTEHSALFAVAKRAPQTVFCLLTALRFHELTTQSPSEVWIAIGNKEHPPRLDYPPLRTVRFSEASLRHGVEVKVVDGVPLRVTTRPKPLPTASSSAARSDWMSRWRRSGKRGASARRAPTTCGATRA